MMKIEIKLNDGILGWLKKNNIKHSLCEDGLMLDPKSELLFKETWMFEYPVPVINSDRDGRGRPSPIYNKLNDVQYTGRGQKFVARTEIVDWCHENGMKFKFEYEMGKRVKTMRFAKEDHQALFLLTWG